MINAKQEIFNNIIEMPKNLHFVVGNSFDKNDLRKCLKYFDLSKPIAVINQGLMRYLDFDEKRLLTSNIYSIIKPNNGVWLTCDFTPVAYIKNQDCKWNNEQKKRYRNLLKQLDDIRCIYEEYNGAECMLERNNYMVNNSSKMIALFYGHPGGTKKTIEYAKEQGLKIVIIKPCIESI